MTESEKINELLEIENIKKESQLEIESIRFFIKLMLKAMYLGTCLVLIIVPLHIIFG